MPRPSANRHPLAVLRTFLKLSQGDMADLLKCSMQTIQRVELGTLKLSEALAKRIEACTHVSLAWLCGGDPSAPIMGGLGLPEPYTREIFERAQAERENQQFGYRRHDLPDTLLGLYLEVRSVVLSAHAHDDTSFAIYKLQTALRELRGEFGEDAESKVGCSDRGLRLIREDMDGVEENFRICTLMNLQRATPHERDFFEGVHKACFGEASWEKVLAMERQLSAQPPSPTKPGSPKKPRRPRAKRAPGSGS